MKGVYPHTPNAQIVGAMGLLSTRKDKMAAAPAEANIPQATTQESTPNPIDRTASQMHMKMKTAHDSLQLKTFERWWNSELPAGSQFGEAGMVKGVASGVACCQLLEKLTGVPFPAHPRTGLTYNLDADGNRHKMMENQHKFLTRVKELGIALVNISEEDLVDGRQTLILGKSHNHMRPYTHAMNVNVGDVTQASHGC